MNSNSKPLETERVDSCNEPSSNLKPFVQQTTDQANGNEEIDNPALLRFRQKLSKIVLDVETRLRKETNALYLEFSSEMKAALQEQTECHNEEKNKLHQEIQDLHSCIDTQDSMIAFKQRIVDNVMNKVQHQQSLLICSKSFFKWRMFVENRKRQAFLMSAATKHFETSLKRKAFQWWLAQLKAGWKNRMEVKAHMEVIEMQKRIVNLYEARIQTLEENLIDASRKINVLQSKHRMDLEYPSLNVNSHYPKKDQSTLANKFREETNLRQTDLDNSLCPDCVMENHSHNTSSPGKYKSYTMAPTSTIFTSTPRFGHSSVAYEIEPIKNHSGLLSVKTISDKSMTCPFTNSQTTRNSKSPSRPQSSKLPKDKKIV